MQVKVDISDIEINEIWSYFNVSTLLILKLFDDICEDCFSLKAFKNNNLNIRIPIHLLAYEYGLLNTYLDHKNYKLTLVFDKKICYKDRNKTTSDKYTNFIERLQNSKYYSSKITHKKQLVILKLNIPVNYYKDIDLIVQSKYSKVSNSFKRKMLINYNKIGSNVHYPISINSNPLVEFLIKKNIFGRIVYKSNNFIKILQEYFNLPSDNKSTDLALEDFSNIEVFKAFNLDKELWHMNQINKYLDEKI